MVLNNLKNHARRTQKASEMTSKAFCGDWEDLDEPFLRLLVLVRAVNEGNFLEKEVGEDIEF